MTRMKSLFAAAVASAIVAVVPAANAQTFHFVGSGSSAQWTMAALAADQLAINQGNGTVCHWTGATGSSNTDALVTDNRDVRILPETGNVWIVWSQNAACSSTTATVTDIWLAVSVDSTVGVRTFSANQVAAVRVPSSVSIPLLFPAPPVRTKSRRRFGPITLALPTPTATSTAVWSALSPLESMSTSA